MVCWYHQGAILGLSSFAKLALVMKTELNAAEEEKEQGRGQRDEEQKGQLGQPLSQPVRPDSPGSEKHLVEVQKPKRGRDQEQPTADNCGRGVQSHAILHDGLSYSRPLSELGDVVRLAGVCPPDRAIVRSIAHLRQLLLDLHQAAFTHPRSCAFNRAMLALLRVQDIQVLQISDFVTKAG